VKLVKRRIVLSARFVAIVGLDAGGWEFNI
jgi:hypothetical protein